MFFSFFPKTGYDFLGTGSTFPIRDIFRYARVDPSQLDDLSMYQFHRIQNGERPDQVSYSLYGTPDYDWTFFVINDSLRKGIQEWPLSQEAFDSKMALDYTGQVIETRPTVIRDSDGLVIEERDSLAGRFTVGESVTGYISKAVGTVTGIDLQLSQLRVSDASGFFWAGELVVGSATGDSVTGYRVWDHKDAPHHYEDGSGRWVYDDLHIGENPAQDGSSDSAVTMVSNYQWETAQNDRRSEIRVIHPDRIYDFARSFRDTVSK